MVTVMSSFVVHTLCATQAAASSSSLQPARVLHFNPHGTLIGQPCMSVRVTVSHCLLGPSLCLQHHRKHACLFCSSRK
jgi:hypothetical protein